MLLKSVLCKIYNSEVNNHFVNNNYCLEQKGSSLFLFQVTIPVKQACIVRNIM
jgi:hypothetical protein